jgi:hypothetical protein
MKEVLGVLALTFPPLVEIWLEETFVELGHGPECSSAVEEIKLLVVLLVYLRNLNSLASAKSVLVSLIKLTINLNFLGFR